MRFKKTTFGVADCCTRSHHFVKEISPLLSQISP